MSNYISDLNTYIPANAARGAGNQPSTRQMNDKFEMNMQDFLVLMVTELQNQSLDSTADTSEMLNQMVMMQMVSALTNMTDASVMGYAASLVGKTVTVGEYDSNGKLQEVVGTVTGTGMMDGQQVVFVNDKYYHLSEIIAVGTLPAKPEKPEGGEGETPEGGETDKVPEGGGTEPTPGTGGTETPEGSGSETPEDGKEPPKDTPDAAKL